MIRLLLILALLIPFNTYADPAVRETLTLSIRSIHLSKKKEYNENNLGIGYERWDSDKSFWATGFYNNSYDDLSLYLARGWVLIERIEDTKIGGVLGGALGYKEKPIQPIIGIFAERKIIGEWSMNGTFFPASKVINKGILFIQLKRDF